MVQIRHPNIYMSESRVIRIKISLKRLTKQRALVSKIPQQVLGYRKL